MRLFALVLAFPSALHAAGGIVDTEPRDPVTCEEGQVYDEKTKACIDARDSQTDLDTIYDTLRRLAYAGDFDAALALTEVLPSNDPMRLTYLGFIYRKQGDFDRGMVYYRKAIAQDPGNNLARSYMGQGFVQAGRMDDARVQLDAIRAHGGAGTWPETSLRNAILTGQTYSY